MKRYVLDNDGNRREFKPPALFWIVFVALQIEILVLALLIFDAIGR